MNKACKQCGKEFQCYPSQDHQYCSRACWSASRRSTKICPNCGKEFEFLHYRDKQYCSRECYSASRRITTICPACGKEFWYHKSWPRKYCSRQCAGKTTVQNIRHFQPNPKRAVQCDNCGTSFQKKAGEIAKTDHHFCSQKCFGKWQSEHRRGKAHPAFAKQSRKCQQCGKTFLVAPNQIKLGWGLFCSRSCKAVWQSINLSGANNPNWRGGYDPYYGPSWREARCQARARDNYTCQYPDCGLTEESLGCELDVHHLKAFRSFGLERHEEANDLSNLKCFCKVHHTLTELRSGGVTDGDSRT